MTKRIVAIAGLLLAFAGTAAVVIAVWPEREADQGAVPGQARANSARSADGTGRAERLDGHPEQPSAPPIAPPARAASPGADIDLRFALRPASGPLPVHLRLKDPPAAGVLFDVDTGELLWKRHARERRPVASLTKMMTALLVAERDPPSDRVAISAKAARTPGSATGLLPAGRKVPLEPLLDALIMISANDAAVALAEHDAGDVTRFVKEMNQRARIMGLTCTRFSTPNGLKDRGNHSCALDLAALARADLANRRIARIARTAYARPRFPIKGHRLHLANNHYFLEHGLGGVPGARVTGLKTGWTDAAGRCYVTTARLGSRHLGVIVLDSPNPLRQVPALLRAAFAATGEMPRGVTVPPPVR